MSKITTDIQEAVDYLEKGNIVAIPTETVYGLAANAENNDAIRQVFEIKQRPLNHPLILHISQDWDLMRWVSFVPNYARILMDHFWPGPLTLVMKTNENQNPLITGGQDTIAIRCPNHPSTQQLLNKLNFPLVAPSANPFGKISPTTAKHVQESFKQETLLILEGGRCQVGIESTIIDATNPETYQILREGIINETDIQRVLPNLSSRTQNQIRVPGKLASHYQPEKPLLYFSSIEILNSIDKKYANELYLISFDRISSHLSPYFFLLPDSPTQAAFELYYRLRQADQSQAKAIAIQLPPQGEVWQAITERIQKAGSSFELNALSEFLA